MSTLARAVARDVAGLVADLWAVAAAQRWLLWHDRHGRVEVHRVGSGGHWQCVGCSARRRLP